MAVYYNEHDEACVAWLRELIAARVIPDGEIDARSIELVRPDDLRGFHQCHFFAGIGGWPFALRLAGWPDERDVWTGSCPCQPYSVAGSGAGIDDPRHLWPTWQRLILERHPATVFGEQTSSTAGRYWLDLVFAGLEPGGYAVGALNLPAAGVRAPHARSRIWFVAHDLGIGRSEFTPSRLHDRGASGDDAVRCGAGDIVADADAARCGSGRSGETRDGRDAARIELAGLRDDGDTVDDAASARRESSRQGPETEARDDARLRGFECGRSGGSGDAVLVADAAIRGQRVDGTTPRNAGHADERVEADPVGVAEREGLEGHVGHGDDGDQSGRLGTVAPRSTAAASEFGELGDAAGVRRGGGRLRGDGGENGDGREPGEWRGDRDRATAPGVDVVVADADGLFTSDGGVQRSRRERRPPADPSFGAWHAAIWIPCTDGKARPIESVVEPLADGVSDYLGCVRVASDQGEEIVVVAPLIHHGKQRVMRLRGYGNAIVPELAAQVVASFLEAEADGDLSRL